ncbi:MULTISPECIES: hypothetical protein [Levilactobacillus]|jgi:hypothetical protein|uniref:Uncharacterized protein n=1 Tax=Levilactobacillus brevis (strain ATCC 367 / BCRC 12310 / CIP 105137 / JCM 1170 / LMG 11437 / NCIMB 947 / NCTC 947) TaxID=387344 RepID=Q03TC7_LEVBA|nr:hypothetical protein [Levilactobacillus brevis]MBL3535902.1 hypothetical protein [Lactobacillus sp. GPR40-2]MBL3629311.1 hypothetical protein [Lactobacillus sp. GPB7-4]ABJ63545.1 hypothetical protein LVIS_0383 [Levilactobacillus brevis ATCC 367]KLE29935.1 hypothetical protein AAX72_05560 [Levilactobacillus brevis]KWT51783.1 hypothetical protein ABB39_02335 [Levilactobacillus brevis]
MPIYLNIVPQAQLDWAQLTTLIGETNSQHVTDVSLSLQLPKGQTLTQAQQRQAAAWSLTIGRPTITPSEQTYLINLRETDRLLPGALKQWQQVIQQHPNRLISLATFDSGQPLAPQVQDYLEQHADSRLHLTLQQLADSKLTTANAQQLTLWGLQNYSVQTNLQSLKYLDQRLRPTGLLLPSMQLSPNLPLASLQQTLPILQSATEVIRLHVPTIARQSWAVTTPLTWLTNLQAIDLDHLALGWGPLIAQYQQHQLNQILNIAGRHQLSRPVHLQLLTQIKQTQTPPIHRWSRLGLLRMLSPRVAHQLFY